MPIPLPAVTARRCEQWYQDLAWMRNKRRENVRERAGQHFGNSDNKRRVSNMIYEEFMTLAPKLIPEEMKAKVSAQFSDMNLDGEIFKMRLDDRIVEIRLTKEAEYCIQDAIDGGIGCILVGETGGEHLVRIDNCEYQIGETYAKAIDPDDLVLDTDARTVGESRCFGHKVRIDMTSAEALGMYGRDPLELIDHPDLQQLCMTRAEAAEALSRAASIASNGMATTADVAGGDGGYITQDEVTEIWETVQWFDRTPYRVAYRAHGDKFHTEGEKYLLIEPYDGPEFSAYHFLVPIMIRGSIVGLAYSSSIRDIHDASVMVAHKITNATLRSKNQGVYEASEADSALTLRDGPDGSFVKVGNAKGIGTIQLGGIHRDALQGFEFLMTQQQKASGSATRADQGGIADTAAEASILAGIQQSRDSGIQRTVRQFLGNVVRSIAWYEYYNPLAKWIGSIPTPGGEVEYEYGPEMRDGDDLAQLYDIDVEITTIQQSDPAMQGQRFIQFMQFIVPHFQYCQEIVGPMAPMSLRGLINIGRNLLGIRQLDEAIPDASRSQMMMPLQQQIQESQPQPTQTPGRQQPGQPGQPAAAGPSMPMGNKGGMPGPQRPQPPQQAAYAAGA